MQRIREIKYRNLDIRLVSADDLKNINIFDKMSVYALAYILGHPQKKKKTVVDKNCGTRPRWNHKMSFPIEEGTLLRPGLTLLVQIKAHKFCKNNKVLGEVYILIPELFQRAGIVGNGKQTGERVVDYQITTLSGRGKGALKIAYAFGEKSLYAPIIDDDGKSKTTNQPIAVHPPRQYYNGKVNHITGVMGYGFRAPQDYIHYHQGGYYILPPQPHSYPPGNGNYLSLGMYPHSVHGVEFHGGMLIGNMMPNPEEMAGFTEGYNNSRHVAYKKLQ